jgi:hypothetical protein
LPDNSPITFDIMPSAPPSEVSFGQHHHLTDFERHVADEQVLPPWWEKWISGLDRACWIVDALDEDVKSGRKGTHRVLTRVQDLSPQARSRLTLIIFARENEVPEPVLKHLREIYPDAGDSETRLRPVQLAPLDAVSAASFVGDATIFSKVCDLIRDNRLESLAGYPVVLKQLKRGSRTPASRSDSLESVIGVPDPRAPPPAPTGGIERAMTYRNPCGAVRLHRP